VLICSKKFMSETLDELSISKGLEYIGEAKKNFLRYFRFPLAFSADAKRQAISYGEREDGVSVTLDQSDCRSARAYKF
jgi:hypothetical protein